MKRIDFYTVKLVKEKGALYDLDKNFVVGSPFDGYKLIQTVLNLQEEATERFGIICLNTKNRIVGIHILHIGNINSSIVCPRTAFQHALLNNAASIIMFHNHPSGDPSPSSEDIAVTKRFEEAGNILGIRVLDHMIIGDKEVHRDGWYSMKEKGYL